MTETARMDRQCTDSIQFFLGLFNSLSCSTCTSEVSLVDCDSKGTTKTCPSGSPNCVTGELTCSAGDVKKTVFYKRCGAQGKTCDITREDRPSCPSSQAAWSYDFENSCCTGNNCNSNPVPSGSSQKISSAVIGVSIVVVLWALTYMY